ncbi:hypothetical protein BDZ91DRAFT_762531 [Kalaharituber pfeilii]|nr:hypothetical protein BDZ91DRAFT_762531 [Kalaharituber pfeilii]
MNETDITGRQSPEINGINGIEDDSFDLLSGSAGQTGSLGRSTTGKSGRVIERLMAENDRLRRELKVETTARAEERKAREAILQSRDSLQSTNAILVHQTNIDKRSLEKKDRKIEELKNERDTERALRAIAERDLRQVQSEGDAELQRLRQELVMASTLREKAVSQYEALAAGWKRLDETYRTKVEEMRRKLDDMINERAKDQALLKRLDITVEQQRQEVEKMRAAKAKVTQRFEECMELAEAGLKDIRARSEKVEAEADRTLAEAGQALDEMRYVMNIKRNVTSLSFDSRENYDEEEDDDDVWVERPLRSWLNLNTGMYFFIRSLFFVQFLYPYKSKHAWNHNVNCGWMDRQVANKVKVMTAPTWDNCRAASTTFIPNQISHQVRVKGVKVEFDADCQHLLIPVFIQCIIPDAESGDTGEVLKALQRGVNTVVGRPNKTRALTEWSLKACVASEEMIMQHRKGN